MKKLSFVLALLFSTVLYASDSSDLQWSDLELYNRYTLTEDITFDNGVSFKANSEFDMLDFISEGIPVAYYLMHFKDCKNPDQTAELVLINVKQADRRDVVIGAELLEGCNVGFYVELRDFFTRSIFK